MDAHTAVFRHCAKCLTGSTTVMGGLSRALGHQYDADGNRTRMTYSDGVYVTFDYDHLDRQTAGHENGGTIVTTITYDAQEARRICIDLNQCVQ